MRPRARWILSGVLALGLATLALPAGADHNQDSHKRMFEEFTSPNGRTNSDFAFWGDHAFSGYYSGSDATPDGGVRIFDISDPAAPTLVRDFKCDGLQADPIVWDRDGNGVADLLMLAVDRTMAAPECGAPRTAHNDPNGWEGVRVFEMSDDPADPFTTITQVKAVYTDCGAHTITAWPKHDESGLLVYVSSYPLRPGPTCSRRSSPPAIPMASTIGAGVASPPRAPWSPPRSPATTSSSTWSTAWPAPPARSRARSGRSMRMGSRTRRTRS